MKTKILLTVVLSLFCLEGLAFRGAVRTVKPSQSVTAEPNTVVGAFPAVPLRATEICSGTCITQAQESLPPEAITALNQTPPGVEKGVFMAQVAELSSVLTAFHSQTPANPREVHQQLEVATKEAQEGLTALAVATQKSISNNWPESAKSNLEKFTASLIEGGIRRAEAEKLEQIKKNCRL